MPTARAGFSSSVVNEKIYAIGGTPEFVDLFDERVTLAVTEEYDVGPLSLEAKEKLATTWGKIRQ